jgi:hypothetical protein
MRDARKNARICPPALLNHIEDVSRKSRGRPRIIVRIETLHYPENCRLDSDQGKAGQRPYPDLRSAGDEG